MNQSNQRRKTPVFLCIALLTHNIGLEKLCLAITCLFPFRVRKQGRFITKYMWQISHLIPQLLGTLSSHWGHVKYRSDITLQMHIRKIIQGFQVQQNQWQSFSTGVTPGMLHVLLVLWLHLLSEKAMFKFFFFLSTNHCGIIMVEKCNFSFYTLSDVPLICNHLIKVCHGSANLYTYSGWPSGLR